MCRVPFVIRWAVTFRTNGLRGWVLVNQFAISKSIG